MERTLLALSALFFLDVAFASLSTQIGSSSQLLAQNQLLSYQADALVDQQSSHPALLSSLEKTQTSLHFFSTGFSFKKTGNIVDQNMATSGNAQRYGEVDPNPPSQMMMAYHFATPLSQRWWLRSLGLSLIAPVPELVILDTTSSFLPKYYWYDSRLNKTEFQLHLTQKLAENFFSSLSLYTQWDVVGQSEMTTGISGGSSSSARLQAQAKPRLFPLLDVIWHMDKHTVGLSWNSSSHQKIRNQVFGQAPLGGSSTVDFAFVMNGQIHVEPMRAKTDYSYQATSQLQLQAGLTYEDWSNLHSSVLQITDSQGVVTNSQDYERLQGRKILSPAIGLAWDTAEKTRYQLSYRFMPSVLDKDNSLSGNSFDQDKHIFALGTYRDLTLFDWKSHWSLALQCHYLPSQQVQKADGQEDGSSGFKIGAPSYPVGGWMYVAALGYTHLF